MYREDSWEVGHYIDNHKKYQCNNCGREFIIGEKQLEYCPPGFPVCPYCGTSHVSRIYCHYREDGYAIGNWAECSGFEKSN